MVEIAIADWFLWALGIGIATSIFLNGVPFLPGVNQLHPGKIARRWTGYITLTSAFWFWIVINPNEPVEIAGITWVLLCLTTLIPNALIHFYQPNYLNIIHPPSTRTERDLLLDALAERLEAEIALRVQKDKLQALLDERDRRKEEE